MTYLYCADTNTGIFFGSFTTNAESIEEVKDTLRFLILSANHTTINDLVIREQTSERIQAIPFRAKYEIY